jgi:hypothetical protein
VAACAAGKLLLSCPEIGPASVGTSASCACNDLPIRISHCVCWIARHGALMRVAALTFSRVYRMRLQTTTTCYRVAHDPIEHISVCQVNMRLLLGACRLKESLRWGCSSTCWTGAMYTVETSEIPGLAATQTVECLINVFSM